MRKRFKPVMTGTLALSLACSLPIPSVLAAASDAVVADAAVQAQSAEVRWVPLRAVAEALGAQIGWEDETRTVTLSRGDVLVSFSYADLAAAQVNGAAADLSKSIRLEDSITVVQLPLLNEWLQSRADWNAETGSVTAAVDDYISRAHLFVAALGRGQADVAHASLAPTISAKLPPVVLQSIWTGNITAFGGIKSLTQVDFSENAVHRNVKLTYATGLQPLEFTLRFDANGLVDDLFISLAQPITKPYKQPEYDQPELYTEQEVVVGQGEWALPGVLTTPVGDGPFPAVVLVQGSGPNDRDTSYGSTRIFRDIAVGLASQGIAVLRYDKVTREHSVKVSTTPKFTIQRETADDALEAVQLLSGHERIDADRIYVAGHSQGGFMVPRMIELDTEGRIAGAVVIAGPSSTFPDVLLQQNEELVKRYSQLKLPTSALEQNVAMVKSIVDTINDPQYGPDQIPADFPLQPAYWWFEMRDYVPTELAATQTTPMLVLQGENDWQVPADHLDGWKQALAKRDNVVYKSYPDLNHFLIEFKELSIGNEYGQPANVAAPLINDIADWVKSNPN